MLRYSVIDRARGLPTHPYRDNQGAWVRWVDVEPYLESLSSALDFLVDVGLEPPSILSDSQMRDYSKHTRYQTKKTLARPFHENYNPR